MIVIVELIDWMSSSTIVVVFVCEARNVCEMNGWLFSFKERKTTQIELDGMILHTSDKVESLALNTGSLHFLVSVLQVAQLGIVCNVKGCQFLVATKGHNGKLHVCDDLDNVVVVVAVG